MYVAVEPVGPFVALQAELADTFPTFPIYGRSAGFRYVPHVTIAEGGSLDETILLADPAWLRLPARGRATALEVIARGGDDRWRTTWRVPLGALVNGGSATSRAADRMRP